MERQTFMEQLNKRVSNIENYLEKIGPVEKLFERIGMLEENIYTTKNNFNFIGISSFHYSIKPYKNNQAWNKFSTLDLYQFIYERPLSYGQRG